MCVKPSEWFFPLTFDFDNSFCHTSIRSFVKDVRWNYPPHPVSKVSQKKEGKKIHSSLLHIYIPPNFAVFPYVICKLHPTLENCWTVSPNMHAVMSLFLLLYFFLQLFLLGELDQNSRIKNKMLSIGRGHKSIMITVILLRGFAH